jgi:hypothetical protein
MPRRGSAPTPVLAALALFALLPAVAVAPATATTTVTAAPSSPPDACFPADGTEFVVGTEGPQIGLTIHLSLLPTLLAGGADAADSSVAAGALGLEATATDGEHEIVSLRTGVLFTGVRDAGRFLADPFAPFALAFDYGLTVPAFRDTPADADYRTTDAPVRGPIEEAACSR